MYWKGSGPLFFYTGNEGAIEGFYDNTGFLFELAENFSALIVFAEHVSLFVLGCFLDSRPTNLHFLFVYVCCAHKKLIDYMHSSLAKVYIVNFSSFPCHVAKQLFFVYETALLRKVLAVWRINVYPEPHWVPDS